MNTIFDGPLANEMKTFLLFKRSLGYGYQRAEYSLQEFDRFLITYTSLDRQWHLGQAALAWLASKPDRKPVSVSCDAAILRQFFGYLRRVPKWKDLPEPSWPKLPTESSFVPQFLSEKDVRKLLTLCADLGRPPFRASLYRALLLVLYCTGLRFGEALRLRLRDVDIQSGLLFVETFKGRSRWVPFHRSLSKELAQYLESRAKYANSDHAAHFFVSRGQNRLPVSTAHATIQRLFVMAGLKAETGRTGPRPYDFRHAFAVHRLSRWYRQGVDLHSRLPWLSAYMGHVDIIGTETYLNATPELLDLAGQRLRRRYRGADGHNEVDEG